MAVTIQVDNYWWVEGHEDIDDIIDKIKDKLSAEVTSLEVGYDPNIQFPCFFALIDTEFTEDGKLQMEGVNVSPETVRLMNAIVDTKTS